MPRKTTTTEPDTTTEESPYTTMKIWNHVQATDPRYTKSFSRGGGFKGTAINHTYQQRRATEMFGPKGIGWGSTVLDEHYADGAPIVHEKLGVIGREVIHVLRIELWYEFEGRRGAIQSYGQTTFVGSNRHGTFTDEEAPKKSLTDAESKALASLGFSADVHLGLFDDSKYVNDRMAAITEAEKPKGPTLQDLMARLEAATTLEDLKTSVVQASLLSDPDKATLKAAYLAKQSALKGAA